MREGSAEDEKSYTHPRNRTGWTQMALTAPLNSQAVTLITHRQADILVPDAGETC